MTRIGFLNAQAEREEGKRRPLPTDWIIKFDGGEAITMEDAKRHVGIFGSTGAGKTASCIYPVIHRHIELGHPIVLIDIKGVRRAKIRGMAKAAGRDADYIEFGTSPSSTPLNIISGMSAAGFNTFLQGLISRAIRGKTGNMDFHFKGARMATDCFRLLDWLAQDDRAFAPTFTMISEMFATCADRRAFRPFREAGGSHEGAEAIRGNGKEPHIPCAQPDRRVAEKGFNESLRAVQLLHADG